MHTPLPVCLAVLALSAASRAATYQAIKEYTTTNLNIFTPWDYYGHEDNLTNGDVWFISEEENNRSPALAYISLEGRPKPPTPPDRDRGILRVDNVSYVPRGGKRRSVRITSQDSFDVGSLWVADIYHAPYGCSVSPSFFSFSKDVGPKNGGEIQIFGGANLHPRALMGIRTPPDAQCRQFSPTQVSDLINSTECSTPTLGCTVTSTNNNSYGRPFSEQKGGVFVTEFAETGISIWFFSRDDIPRTVAKDVVSVDTATLGTPMGHWPALGCDIRNAFGPQRLGFEITLCGDLAGDPEVFNQTCSGRCYDDYVFGQPGSIYQNAWFDIEYIKVFSSGTQFISSNTTPTRTDDPSSASASNASQRLKADLLAALFAAFGVVTQIWYSL